MEILLAVGIYVVISIGFLIAIKKLDISSREYDTRNIRGDARASQGMFVYMSEVEESREKLERTDSKF